MATEPVKSGQFINSVVERMDADIAEIEEVLSRLRTARAYLTGELSISEKALLEPTEAEPPEAPAAPPRRKLTPVPAPPPATVEDTRESEREEPVAPPPAPPKPPPARKPEEAPKPKAERKPKSRRTMAQMQEERRQAAAAEQARRKPIIREWITNEGIFTGKRLVDAMQEKIGAKRSIGELLEIAEWELGREVLRHGGMRGPGVYFTHKDYRGRKDLTIARGGVSFGETLRDVKSAKKAEEAEAGDKPADAPKPRKATPSAKPHDPRPEITTTQVRQYIERVHRGTMFTTRAVAQEFVKPMTWAHGKLNELAHAGVIRKCPHDQWQWIDTHERTPSLTQVRDRVVQLGDGTYSPSQVVGDEKDWDTETVKLRMRELATMGIVEDESIDESMQLFTYKRPSTPGKAAQMESRREKQGEVARSQPVAGTGKPERINNKDVAGLINKIKAVGGVVSRATNSHWQVVNPKMPGKKVLISSTPRGTRTVENDRIRVRRQLGLTV